MVPVGAMASVFRREGREKWYSKFRDPETLKWKSQVTPYRLSDPNGKRKALVWANDLDKLGQVLRQTKPAEAWWRWVPDWITFTYSYDNFILIRYRTIWSSLFDFLETKKVEVPRQLEYRHSQEYMQWRVLQKRKGGKHISHNTAIMEVKILGRIMKEAHLRGYCDTNPFYRMGLKRRDTKEKTAITREEHWKIVKGLRALGPKRQWMRRMYIVAMHQGCRKSETSVPLEDVNLKVGTIKFRAKGHSQKKHVFTTALHPRLKHFVRWCEANGEKTLTGDRPKHDSRVWWEFFHKIGLPHLSFHSTRVTVVTQMARNGVSKQKAMRFVGHASETVHRIYERMVPEDVADVSEAIRF